MPAAHDDLVRAAVFLAHLDDVPGRTIPGFRRLFP
jgi:hypothetical protein